MFCGRGRFVLHDILRNVWEHLGSCSPAYVVS